MLQSLQQVLPYLLWKQQRCCSRRNGCKVINIHTIKPLDEDLIVAAAKETGKVVTVEEHSVIGGLGGAVCEVPLLRESTCTGFKKKKAKVNRS